jgi:hypothetical protein
LETDCEILDQLLPIFRHPQILTVQHPLEESRDCLAFATEPVLASLANVLGGSAQHTAMRRFRGGAEGYCGQLENGYKFGFFK